MWFLRGLSASKRTWKRIFQASCCTWGLLQRSTCHCSMPSRVAETCHQVHNFSNLEIVLRCCSCAGLVSPKLKNPGPCICRLHLSHWRWDGLGDGTQEVCRTSILKFLPASVTNCDPGWATNAYFPIAKRSASSQSWSHYWIALWALEFFLSMAFSGFI